MAEPENEFETWTNPTLSRIVLVLRTAKGDLAPTMIGGHKTFHLTPTERRVNQELAAGPDQDVFQNGMLTPVHLIDGEEDTALIASSPNLLGEDEMAALVKGHHKTFEKKVGEITNALTLKRLLDITVAADAPISKVSAVRARLAEIAPSLLAGVPFRERGPAREGPRAPTASGASTS